MSMLDDFVESSAGPSRPYRNGNANGPDLNNVDYEGFEVDSDDEGDDGMAQALETGFLPSRQAVPPIFSLSLVQFRNPPSHILSLAAANNLLFIASYPLSIMLIDLDQPLDIVTVDLPKPAPDKNASTSKDSPVITNLYVDPAARHLLATTNSGDTFYLPITPGNTAVQSRRPRPLRLRQTVTTVAWSPLVGEDKDATDVFLGTASGAVLSLPLPPQDDIFKSVSISMSKPVERDLQTVYSLEHPVHGLAFGVWKQKPKRAWLIMTTKERVYEAQGDLQQGKGWAEVFKMARDAPPKLPGDLASSDLRVHPRGAPTSLAWTTAPVSDLLKPALIPYPAPPISLTITEWHYLLLYPERVVGIAREDERVIWDEPLSLAQGESPVCLCADPVSKTFWVATNQNVLEVLVRDEERDVWRQKLGKADYTDALYFAKTRAQKDIVLSRQADWLFEQGRFIQAAQAYAKSSRSFEFVALRFVDSDRDALRIYLSDRLDLLDRRDRTQRMMLATWLVEIYLSKCNTLEDIVAAESATSDVESLSIEREMMQEDMQNFITTYQNDLDVRVVYDLIQSHGRTDLYLFYAKLNKDHAKVVEHHVTEEAWRDAIDVLARQDSLELYYRFASILIRHAPKETVDAWLRRPELSARRLVPALLQSQKHAIRYLEAVIPSSTDPVVHNLLLTLYATDSDEALLQYLNTAPTSESGGPYYDLDYALRLCKQHGRTLACVHVYAQLGLYEDSVELALEKGDLELARINADRPEEEEVRRKLWLRLAKWVVQEKNDIKSAMAFLESTDLIQIEDILPFFPDFVVIDEFKSEICGALETYAARIDALRREMDEATATAENIKQDIAGLADRFVTIEQGDRCWRCGLALVVRQFYAFPCQHMFHADCLISMVTEFLPAPALRRLLHLQNELVKQDAPRTLLSQAYTASGSTTPRAGAGRLGERDGKRREVTSGNAATDLLLGVTGRNKLLAAGDRLREMVVPDALAQAISAVGSSVPSVSMSLSLPGLGSGSGSGDKDGKGEKGRTAKARKRVMERDEEARMEQAGRELDELVAEKCPLCEGCVVGLDKGFIGEDEDVEEWEV